MALRLFRTTGYSTLLMPGEARLAMHPAWMVLATSLWLALVCNVGVWRLLADRPDADPRFVLATIALIGGGSFAGLSLLGWRRTFKMAATLLLLGAALAACGLWIQGLPLEALWQQRPRAVVPGWATFMGWQVPVLMLLLAVVPTVWIWHVPLRRLPGPMQLQANILGALAGAVVFLAGLTLLGPLP